MVTMSLHILTIQAIQTSRIESCLLLSDFGNTSKGSYFFERLLTSHKIARSFVRNRQRRQFLSALSQRPKPRTHSRIKSAPLLLSAARFPQLTQYIIIRSSFQLDRACILTSDFFPPCLGRGSACMNCS